MNLSQMCAENRLDIPYHDFWQIWNRYLNGNKVDKQAVYNELGPERFERYYQLLLDVHQLRQQVLRGEITTETKKQK